jgi:hypothetical protein
MENKRDSQLVALRKVVSKYAKKYFIAMEKTHQEQNVHRAYAKLAVFSLYTKGYKHEPIYATLQSKSEKNFDPKSYP